MQKLHEGTLEYTQQRKQFGVPIAKFQVLQHRMVDMFMEVEQARSMTMMGTLKLGLPATERMAAVSAAKAKVARGATFVGDRKRIRPNSSDSCATPMPSSAMNKN